jgi:hypothetical protein
MFILRWEEAYESESGQIGQGLADNGMIFTEKEVNAILGGDKGRLLGLT